MKRYIFSLQQKAVAHKDPDQLIDKLVSFVFLVRCLAMKYPYDATDIIAMDETLVWANGDCKNNWTRKNLCFQFA